MTLRLAASARPVNPLAAALAVALASSTLALGCGDSGVALTPLDLGSLSVDVPGSDASDAVTPDADSGMHDGPDPDVRLGPAWPAAPSPLDIPLDAPRAVPAVLRWAEPAAFAWPTPGGVLLDPAADAAAGPAWWGDTPGGPDPEPIARPDADPEAPPASLDAATAAPATVGGLVADGAGQPWAFVLDGPDGPTLVASPLAELLADRVIVDLAPSEGALWIATTVDLLRYDLTTEVLAVAGGADSPAAAALAPAADGTLWVAEGPALERWGLGPDGTTVLRATVRDDVGDGITALSATADGRVWLLLADGTVLATDASGLDAAWWRLEVDGAPLDVASLHAAPADPEARVWLAVAGAPVGPGSGIASGLVLGEGGQWNPVTLAPPSDEEPVPLAGPVALLAADRDGRAWASTATGGTARLAPDGPPPEPPPPPPPTWVDDLAPLSDARCGQCHGPGQLAHPMHTRAHWIDEFDAIVAQVAVGAMPLPPNPPLTEVELALLAAWAEVGFPEDASDTDPR